MDEVTNGGERELTMIYKVVSVNSEGVLQSAIVALMPGDFCVQYQVGVTTVPAVAGSLLFAFNTLEAAKAFTWAEAAFLELEIWEAEAEVCLGAREASGLWIPVEQRDWKDFWPQRRTPYSSRAVPTGTVLCRSVELLRRVWPEEGEENSGTMILGRVQSLHWRQP